MAQYPSVAIVPLTIFDKRDFYLNCEWDGNIYYSEFVFVVNYGSPFDLRI